MRAWLAYLHAGSLRALCRLRGGHHVGQWFNELFGGSFPDERPWCDRCGAQQTEDTY